MTCEHNTGRERKEEHFPTVWWDHLRVSFHPSPRPDGLRPTFAIVFARHGDGFVLADIPGRGWITPSGRLEPGEEPMHAAVRETWEEIGATLEDAKEIGYYVLRPEEGKPMHAAAFIGRVGAFGKIPPESESLGARLVGLGELPGLYWRWDPLLEAMFRFASGIP